MKKMMMVAFLLCSSTGAFASQIKLTGEAGKSVCSLLNAMRITETVSSNLHYEDGLISTDRDGVVDFNKGTVRCKGFTAVIRGETADVGR